jgi:hypothetical protein
MMMLMVHRSPHPPASSRSIGRWRTHEKWHQLDEVRPSTVARSLLLRQIGRLPGVNRELNESCDGLVVRRASWR